MGKHISEQRDVALSEYLVECLQQFNDIERSLREDRITGPRQADWEMVCRRRTRFGEIETWAGVYPRTTTQEIIASRACKLAQLQDQAIREVPRDGAHPTVTAAVKAVAAAHDALLNDAYRASESDYTFSEGVLERWSAAILDAKAYVSAFGPPLPAPPARTAASCRPAYGRDHLFLTWSAEGLTPAAIRDRWNALSDDERRRVCPAAWRRVRTGESGRNVLKQAIRKAKKEKKS